MIIYFKTKVQTLYKMKNTLILKDLVKIILQKKVIQKII